MFSSIAEEPVVTVRKVMRCKSLHIGHPHTIPSMAAFCRFGSRMRLVEPDDSKKNEAGPLQPNSAAEDFFNKMNHDFRRPKPSEEAVAAALQAIQALAGDTAPEGSREPASAASSTETDPGACPKCGGVNSESNRFCGFCGGEMAGEPRPAQVPQARTASAAAEQHIHHHHHHYFPGGTKPVGEAGPAQSFHPATESLSAGESPVPAGVDAILRKLVQEWVMLCNGNRVDELAALYAGDAVLIRPGILITRGSAAIKSVLQADLDSGLGDVHLECSDIAVLKDVACVTGVSRMLWPVSPANRQERAGKFLLLVRREVSGWNIVADAWCIDGLHPTRSARPRK